MPSCTAPWWRSPRCTSASACRKRAPASRLHAAAWTGWWLAFLPGALTVAFARRRIGGGAPALLLLLPVSLLVPLLVLGGTLAIPAPLAQRLAVLAWFTWWIVAGRRG